MLCYVSLDGGTEERENSGRNKEKVSLKKKIYWFFFFYFLDAFYMYIHTYSLVVHKEKHVLCRCSYFLEIPDTDSNFFLESYAPLSLLCYVCMVCYDIVAIFHTERKKS